MHHIIAGTFLPKAAEGLHLNCLDLLLLPNLPLTSIDILVSPWLHIGIYGTRTSYIYGIEAENVGTLLKTL